jgi:hypothetical protein
MEISWQGIRRSPATAAGDYEKIAVMKSLSTKSVRLPAYR